MVVVNLINASGEEGALASVFSRDVTLLHNPSVRYFHFDFHDYCRNNRYDQVSVMYSMLRDEHKQMGFVLFLSFLSFHDLFMCVSSTPIQVLLPNRWRVACCNADRCVPHKLHRLSGPHKCGAKHALHRGAPPSAERSRGCERAVHRSFVTPCPLSMVARWFAVPSFMLLSP